MPLNVFAEILKYLLPVNSDIELHQWSIAYVLLSKNNVINFEKLKIFQKYLWGTFVIYYYIFPMDSIL